VTTVAHHYPAELEAEVALRDGSLIRIRPIRPEDAEPLLAFLRALPEEDRRLRFSTLGNDLDRAARDETHVDYVHSLGLVATVGPEKDIVGHGLYAPYGDACADVAFAIAREYQGLGLATLLLGHLAQAAAANGIETFKATVLPENQRMLDVLRDSGFPIKMEYDVGAIEVTFPTSLSADGLASFEDREEVASANALQRVLYPGSVAVIGASRDAGAVGAVVVRNLVASGFRGRIYPVNPSASTIQDLTAYPSVESIPGHVDLAVVAVPAASVMEVAEQCGRKGVQTLLVLSAGFGEIGEQGRQRQDDLLHVCRTHGMRLIGPNCFGVINTDPLSPMNATFGPVPPVAGRIGLAGQGSAVGLAPVDIIMARELGFSSVVSMGNRADISSNDLLGFWHSDPRTDVILLYLESFGNPRKFARLARSIGKSKPIVALKSGRSPIGARARDPHTNAFVASSDVKVDALFRQAGVIRTDTLDEMLDVADLLVHQPLPAGSRVAIVTNVDGPAIVCADTCRSLDLHVPALSESTQSALRRILPTDACVLNPVDMLASATPEQYREVVRLVADDPNVDAIIVISFPLLVGQPQDVARAVAAAIETIGPLKPVLGVFMSATPMSALTTPTGRIPDYRMPEPAARALAHVVRYADWKSQLSDVTVELPDVQRHEAALLLAEALGTGGGWLAPGDVRRLLKLYGVPTIEPRVAPHGVEMLISVVNDPQFGPTVACGPGGSLVGLLKDLAVRLTPLAHSDASGMLHELRSFPLLNGYRGSAPCDTAALEDALRRIGALADDHSCIAELDCNPVVVTAAGASVVNARIRLETPTPHHPLGARLSLVES
jgi:acetyl coenzyme A synthetase (ADP forming)-like protein